MTNITPKQKECLEVIAEFMSQNGYSPTLAQVGEVLSQSAVSVHRKVNQLAQRGFLVKRRRKRHYLRLTKKAQALLATY